MTPLTELITAAAAGALIRTTIGIANAWSKKEFDKIDWTRVAIETLQGIICGIVAITILQTYLPGMKNLPTWLTAGLAGITGGDLLNIALKKLGLPKITFNLPTKQISGINERQQKALNLAQTRQITNNDYEKLNNVSDSTAQRELKQLVQKGLLKKEGIRKGTKYNLP